MTARRRLPDRRLAETFELEIGGLRYTATVGRHADGRVLVRPIGRPDLDNFVKSGLDSINEIVIRDDSQVVEATARKRYSTAPKLVMTVFPLSEGGKS
jgi:Holliday junction resolvase RusA-like endonuclease